MRVIRLEQCRKILSIVTLLLTLTLASFPRTSLASPRAIPRSYRELGQNPLEAALQSDNDEPAPEILHLGSQRYSVLCKSPDKR